MPDDIKCAILYVLLAVLWVGPGSDELDPCDVCPDRHTCQAYQLRKMGAPVKVIHE